MRLLLSLSLFLFSFVAAQEALAAVRFVHLSPDAPLVDLVVDNTTEQKDIAFGTVTGYVWVRPGRHDLTLYPHRAPEASTPLDFMNLQNVLDNDADRAPVAPLEPFTITINVEADGYYTVALAGFFVPPSGASELGSLTLDLERGTRVQVLGPRSFLGMVDKGQTLSNLEPGLYRVNAKREGFEDVRYEVAIDPGETSTLAVTLAEEAAETSETGASNVDEDEPTWHRAQLYLYEDAYDTFPAPGRTLLRVVHAAPGLSAQGLSALELRALKVNEEGSETTPIQTLTESLKFPNATAYLSLEPGEQTLEVRLAGSDFSLVTLDATLSAGTLYTLYLSSSVSEGVLTPIPSVDAVLRAALTKPR